MSDARLVQHHRDQQQSSSTSSSSSSINARAQLTREVLNVLFARPLAPRSRRAFGEALVGLLVLLLPLS